MWTEIGVLIVAYVIYSYVVIGSYDSKEKCVKTYQTGGVDVYYLDVKTTSEDYPLFHTDPKQCGYCEFLKDYHYVNDFQGNWSVKHIGGGESIYNIKPESANKCLLVLYK